MARYPIDGVVGTPFGVFRRKDGKWHWGVDIAAAPGGAVVAPEDLEVVRVWTADVVPFVGYGPGGVLARGLETPGGPYHLIAHLDAGDVPTVGEIIDEGSPVGVVSSLAHVHWEIRREPLDSPSTRSSNTYDPVAWVAGRGLVEKSRGAGILWLALALYLISRR